MPSDAETADDEAHLDAMLAEALDSRDETRIALMTRWCLLRLRPDLDPPPTKLDPYESPSSAGRHAEIEKVNGENRH